MAADHEPAKLLLPYLQRADELQKHEPLVAYYCRLYSMERGMKIAQKERTKTTNSLLISLMSQLEKDKKSLTLGPDDHLHVEGFALNVFSKADKQDRAGRADLNTAKTFYAASIFFEILNQFSDVQPDLEQKQKYAAWKAADIRKAVKEGRKPVPGPPGGDDDSSLQSSGEYGIGPRENDFAIRHDPSTVNPSGMSPPVSHPSPPPYNNLQHSTSFPSQPLNVTPSPSNTSTPHLYPDDSLPPDIYHQPNTSNGSEHPQYPESYIHQQPYLSDPKQHYPTQSYPFPNFQSYPSFAESSLPTVPSQHPFYYQGPDASYSNLPPPANTANYPSSVQYDSVARQGSVSDASPTSAQKYEYDSTYEPLPEDIAEAQKAARFAVGALAFDDVFVAVDHLKKALGLLTKPSAGH